MIALLHLQRKLGCMPKINLAQPFKKRLKSLYQARKIRVMHVCVRGIDFVSISTIFKLDFGTVPIV